MHPFFQIFPALRQVAGLLGVCCSVFLIMSFVFCLEKYLDYIFWESCLSSLSLVIVVKTDWLELMDAAELLPPVLPEQDAPLKPRAR